MTLELEIFCSLRKVISYANYYIYYMNPNVTLRLSILILIYFFLSCNVEKVTPKVKNTGGLAARVYLPAGEIHPSFNKLDVPTFFNLAKISSEKDEDINAIVLGEKRSKGFKLSIYPIALFSFQKDTSSFKYVVAVDASNDKINREYNAFLMNDYHMQQAVESWFKSQCSDHECKSFKWENKYKALLEVSN